MSALIEFRPPDSRAGWRDRRAFNRTSTCAPSRGASMTSAHPHGRDAGAERAVAHGRHWGDSMERLSMPLDSKPERTKE